MLDVFLALLYPPRCALCRRELRNVGPPRLCGACVRRFEIARAGCERCGDPGAAPLCVRCHRAPPAFTTVHACFTYRADGPPCPLKEAIGRWKYGRDLRLGRALATLFAQQSAAPEGASLVVPVPIHRHRLLRRGFDQAAMLAAAYARSHRTPLLHALLRTSSSVSQTTLGRGARRENVRGRFAVRSASGVIPRSIVLVDDVVTSGATANECAAALVSAGAARIEVRALARAVGARGDPATGGKGLP